MRRTSDQSQTPCTRPELTGNVPWDGIRLDRRPQVKPFNKRISNWQGHPLDLMNRVTSCSHRTVTGRRSVALYLSTCCESCFSARQPHAAAVKAQRDQRNLMNVPEA